MNHPFIPSAPNPTLCATCERKMIDHTDRATCEICGNSGEMTLSDDGILQCENHIPCVICGSTTKELLRLSNGLGGPVKYICSDCRTNSEGIVRNAREVDATIKISTDIFNAKTLAIHAIKKAIDDNPAIPADKKYFELATIIDARFTKLTDIIFGAREEILHAENEQRAIQTYYNDLGKRLRAEEKEKIRLKDATYKPIVQPDVQKTPKAPKIKSAPNPNEVRAACVREGIPDAVALVTMLMIAKKFSVDDAIGVYKQTKGIA